MRHPKLKQLNPNQHAISALATIVITVIIVAAVIGTILTASRLLPSHTIIGSRNLTTKNYDFTNFTAIEIGGGFKAEITRSNTYSVHVTADNNTIDFIDVSKTDNTLTIQLRTGYSFVNVTLRTQITMPNLYAVTLSSGTQATASEFPSTQDFTAELSGGSTLEIEGSARNLQIHNTGGSRADLSDFPVHNATVYLSGGSQATINLNGRLDATLSGGSQLQYIGTPTMGDINTSGGSAITKRQ